MKNDFFFNFGKIFEKCGKIDFLKKLWSQQKLTPDNLLLRM